MRCEWRVSQAEAGDTLLQFLRQKEKLKDYSARKIKSWIDAGLSSINNRTERFHHTPLSQFDIITIIVPETKSIEFSKERILYEDAFLLVYDKPAGVSCEEKGGIVDHLKEYAKVYMVHRLDKQTSGCLLLAKTKDVKEKLIEQFKNREVKKQYLAIVDGNVSKETGNMKDFLVREKSIEGQAIWKVSKKGGLLAETDFEVLSSNKFATLIRLYPHTGRTHQLRVQLSFRKHPILGDRVYGNFTCNYPAERHLLHAEALRFLHPENSSTIDVKAKQPDDLKKAILKLFKEKE